MALTKPILNDVPAWDVANGYTFIFNVLSGDQVVGNTLYIRNNTTNAVIYTKSTTSFKYEAIVPANAAGLQNGTYYNAYITTMNANGEVSAPSNVVQFYCYSEPTWRFSNISQGGTVENSSVNAEVQYSQAQGEPLSSYNITLYNASQTPVSTSGTVYISPTSGNITVSHLFSGLEDNTAYYIRATGQTANGMVVDTGFIRFTVQYTSPAVYSRFSLSNNCSEGYVTYTSYASVIEGVGNPDPPIYIDGTSVDLREEDAYVAWNEGFSIAGDFTMKVWFLDATPNSTLFTIENEKGELININYYVDPEDSSMVYAMLDVDGKYMIYTPSISKPMDTTEICVQVRRINHIYDLFMEAV